MNIVLIGFMGTGKSVAGQVLAHELGMRFLDTDALIEKTEKTAIGRIFGEKGEPYFRDLESRVIKTLQDYDNFVIATGGGIVLREENVRQLKEVGPLVLLWAEPEAIYERVKKEKHRPLLNVVEPLTEIKKLLALREPFYRRAADLEVETSKRSVDQVVEEIKTWLRSKSS
jgi:shikimate kinase